MRKITILLGLLALVIGSACGDQSSSRGKDGSQVQPAGAGELAPQGGNHFGPPPEAFKACEGKTAGSALQIEGPNGEMLNGTCEEDRNGKLAFRPDRPEGDARGEHRGPPPEAYQACAGKSAGNTAQFVNPRGDMVSGTCEADPDGKLVLRPEGGPRGGHDGPPPEAYSACEGKSAGGAAQFVNPHGDTVSGTCEADPDGKLVLRPEGGPRGGHGGPPPEAYAACEGKSAGGAAQFVNRRGQTISGTCEERDGKLVLRPDHLPGLAGDGPR